MPNIDDIPKTCGYKYVKTAKQIKPIEFKQKELNDFYENIIFQITLKTINEIFISSSYNYIDSIVFNGWINGIDKATGNDFTSCILSVQALKKDFTNLNLSRKNLLMVSQ